MTITEDLSVYEMWKLCRSARATPTLKNGVVRVAVVETLHTTYVAFPGTGEGMGKISSVLSWLINAIHISTAGRHSGWLAQLLSIYLPLRRHLKKNKRIVCTGYSQGAALALLLCDHLKKKGFNAECHGFAAPRPFRLWYKVDRSRMFYYRNGNDLVTHLPTWTLFYKHGAQQIKVGGAKFLPSIKDHFPDQYDAALKDL